jgi:outer membrane protein insertion porin family
MIVRAAKPSYKRCYKQSVHLIFKKGTSFNMKRVLFLFIGLLYCCLPDMSYAQSMLDSIPVADFTAPKEYEIGAIRVVGARFSDENAIISISGLRVGENIRIPGPNIHKAIKALWKLRLFTDVQISQEKTIGDVVFLEIKVTERPNFAGHSFKGVAKSYHDDLNGEVNRFLLKGAIVTEGGKANAASAITTFFREKGFLDCKVKVEESEESAQANSVRLTFDISKGARVRINTITFVGNEHVKSAKLRRKLQKTKQKKGLFATSKLLADEYENDKNKVIKFYNTIGYRDAIITGDSIWRDAKKGDLNIRIDLSEGPQYRFGDIVWKGNSIYDSKTLSTVLGIKPGDIYNQELLQKRLTFSEDGRDVSSLYMDNGYLFFNVDPVEVSVENDSIDLEMRVMEGPLATIDRVIIKGNDRTHEHVIRRELRTLPGNKFSRSDIIRSNREITNLGYFNQETLGINTPVNRARGTVDIEYTVEEKPSDQLELSAGWGAFGVVGTLGVSFNNFSTRNFFKKEAWSPLPQGDGQRLSIRAQTNGKFFQSYNLSFTEPWLGGKKPTSLTIGAFYSASNRNYSNVGEDILFTMLGGSIGLGTRLKFPDDNFLLSSTLNYQQIGLENWTPGQFVLDDGTYLTDGKFNNLSLQTTLSRNSVSDPIYPRSGSLFSVTAQLTPPYALFSSKDPSQQPAADRFKLLEYHKWKVAVEWYNTIVGKLVLKSSVKMGFLGYYDKRVGLSPFERFVLGGDGLSGQNFFLTGNDLISMRGYDVDDIEASNNGGAAAYNKITFELRYPFSLSPTSTIFMHTFVQGGNAWKNFRDYNPFELRRSAGLGLRVFLPMFGMLGFDYGWGFDKPNLIDAGKKWTEFGKFNIILGFEPE